MSGSIKVLHKINVPINTDTNEAILSAIKECAYRGDVYFCNKGLSVICSIRDAVIDIQFQTFNRY